ncbi:MAG: AhpC/TSA family protein [Sandaracinaceae bacterium]|nr:AhpC/TSA family protein [Sandaracinaceae bacterium]
MRATLHAPVLDVGDRFPPRELPSLASGAVRIPDARRLVHLQLRRFAGCPICSLHLRSFTLRHDELLAAGVREVAVFHSSREELEKVHTDLPFAVVPDPDKHLYAELGVGTSPRAMLDPRAWMAAARAAGAWASKDPTAGMSDGSFGLPGDFLIAPDGTILALKRGVHADDQWSVDELLAAVRATGGR